MKTKTIILISLLVIVTLFSCFGCYLIYRKTIEENISPIQNSFYSILSYEGEIRLEKSGLPFSFSNVQPDETIESGIISFQTEDSVSYIKKDLEYKTKPLFERRAHAIQTALIFSGHPMKAITIDSLLTEKLHSQKIYATIGIRYVNNLTKEVEDSKPGDLVYNESSTDLILLGIKDEIEVQVFYKMSFISIFRQEPIPFVLLAILWLAIIFISIVFYFRKPPQKVVYVPISNIKTTQDEKTLLQVCSSVYFDQAKLEIQYNNQAISLTKQLATLFTAFLEAPDYYLSNEQIEELFWPRLKNSHQSRIQLAKRLREVIKSVPWLKIENINQKGYQLRITEG